MAIITPEDESTIVAPITITSSAEVDIATPNAINPSAGDGSINAPATITAHAIVPIGKPSA